MASLQSCGPCNCTTYGGRSVYNITAQPIQRWLTQANEAGRAFGMNPATILAIASIETNGDYTAVSGNSYGIVQVDQNHLNAYNCNHGSTFKLTDLIAQGPNIYDANTAVQISFYILAQYMGSVNRQTSSYKLTATGWNGAICGQNGSLQPYGNGCGYWPIPSGASCYGVAALQLASAYSGWWINPTTGQPDSFYFGPLSAVSYDTLPTTTTVCYGP